MLVNAMSSAAMITVAATCAVQAAATPIPPQKAAIIEAACTSIMGLRHGEFQYMACRDSLSNTAAGQSAGEAERRADEACHDRGFAAGSAALATCILDNEAQAPAAGAASTSAVKASVPTRLVADSSYFEVTHAVQWRREQYSCAQLGLVPESAAFNHCVAGLDADLQSDQP